MKALLGTKIGMTQIISEDGRAVPVTLIQAGPVTVTQVKSVETDGYNAVQLGVGTQKTHRVTQPMRGHFAKANVEPKRKLQEFRVSSDNLLDVGDEITADHFVAGQKVDISGVTVGKGFAGGMKRWNFRGLEASHGVSISHRSHGSTGNRQDPGRTFPGKKMAGHYGAETVTTQNLTVVRVDAERGLILIKGAVPGHDGGYVKVRDAIKKARPADAPFPGAVKSAKAAAQPASTPAEEAPVEATEGGEA